MAKKDRSDIIFDVQSLFWVIIGSQFGLFILIIILGWVDSLIH